MQLEVGQLLMSQRRIDGTPAIAKVIRVNKNTYRIKKLCGDEVSISKSNLMETDSWYGYGQAYIPLDMSQITKEVIDRFMSIQALEKKRKETSMALEEAKDLIGHAKYFLSQVQNIEEIAPEEPESSYNDFYDYEAEERGDNDYCQEEEEDE